MCCTCARCKSQLQLKPCGDFGPAACTCSADNAGVTWVDSLSRLLLLLMGGWVGLCLRQVWVGGGGVAAGSLVSSLEHSGTELSLACANGSQKRLQNHDQRSLLHYTCFAQFLLVSSGVYPGVFWYVRQLAGRQSSMHPPARSNAPSTIQHSPLLVCVPLLHWALVTHCEML